jgi:hypothetical protein
MTRPSQTLSLFVARLLITLAVSIAPALAQQPAPPPAPSDPPAAKPDDPKPKDNNPKDPGKDSATDKPDDSVGKSKLEKETGTINDRIFEVLPNYGTVESSKAPPPLRSSQKFRLATASVFDWAAYPFNGLLAAIGQAKNDPKSWGQGWDAYAKRYGASFADNSIGTYMTTAIFPSLLHEDPRYYQMGKGTFRHRSLYALSRLFVTRTDSGKTRFNYSESVGNAAAAAISNIYHPAEDRTASRNATSFVLLILYDGLSNEVKEFWPDIRRKVFHKETP